VLRRFKRQALHAARLAFVHPVSGAAVDLEIEPPGDFRHVVETMRRDSADD
jgi:23S rRNA pseudouridine1911/1915/1917 synthase